MAENKGSGGRKSAGTGSDGNAKAADDKGSGVNAKPTATKKTPAKSPASKSAATKPAGAKTAATAKTSGSAVSTSKADTTAKPDPAMPGQGAPVDKTSEITPKSAAETPKTSDAKPAGGPAPSASSTTGQTAATSVPKTSTARSSASAETAKLTEAKAEPAKPVVDTPKPAPAQPPASQTANQSARRGGFLPLLLGGACAAAIGFGAAYFILPEMGVMLPAGGANTDLSARLDDQAGRVDALQKQIADIPTAPDGPDLSGLESSQQALESGLAGLTEQLATLTKRMDQLESQPAADGGVSPGQLNALRDAVTAQTARIDALTSEAEQLEDAARASAQQELRRAALTRIRTALDTGSGFAPALGDLERAGMSANDALQEVAEAGVPTQAALQERFAPAARAALAAARRDKTEGGDNAGLWSFVSDQLGARSLERREGPGVDAVLSRAEDDVRQGKLDSALSEIDALPEPAKAELADWAADVRARMQALAAHDALAAKLN
ncbi:COG4223 family protein [Roseovarius sp. Pro17]|uniref:COG4223 family protein n=1 Tax=Roseovarius sp. Pro17 TaxID=3108175 RepID=UPI002D79F573|nr:mitofilin family membrane protein [Roseovarius sp. Pro17]